jgi:hypothetical protein
VEVDSGERETEAHRNKRVFLQHGPEVGNRPWHAKGRMWKCTVVYAHDEILSNKKNKILPSAAMINVTHAAEWHHLICLKFNATGPELGRRMPSSGEASCTLFLKF